MGGSEETASVAKCGSTWVFLVGLTAGLLTLAIDWVWKKEPNGDRCDVAIGFGTTAICLYVPFSLLVSHGANSSKVGLLKLGIIFGILSNLFSIGAFGYWVYWCVNFDVGAPKIAKDLGIAATVFYFLAMCTFGGTLGAAANLVKLLEAAPSATSDQKDDKNLFV